MTKDLPPLLEQYPEQLEILAVNTQTVAGQLLFLDAMQAFGAPEPYRVPTLIAGDTVLRGSAEIPALFPGLFSKALAAGSIGWPAIPGLAELMAADAQPNEDPAEAAPNQVGSAPPPSGATMREKFAQDSLSNSLSILVLVGMQASLAVCLYAWMRLPDRLGLWAAGWIRVLSG